jgi:hypothetical protein
MISTLALSLVAGAGLAIHSFLSLTRVDLGVRTDHVLMFYLPIPDMRSKDPALISAHYRQLLTSISAVPGVMSVSAQTGTPLDDLIPMQNGELSPADFYRRAVQTSGLALVPAMPMKKAATDFDGVLAFAREIRPRRIHLLGMGYETRREWRGVLTGHA